MIKYSYTPGDRIIALDEDVATVLTEDQEIDIDLMDLFESWVEYNFLDEDVLEENKSARKDEHCEIMSRSKDKDIAAAGEVKEFNRAVGTLGSWRGCDGRGHKEYDENNTEAAKQILSGPKGKDIDRKVNANHRKVLKTAARDMTHALLDKDREKYERANTTFQHNRSKSKQ